MDKRKVTIIVPAYRAERTIRKCLDSVISQAYSDWECILVNDGSPDCSGEICEEYAAKDSRFIVFHKANGGASSARNLGLDNARGEWIVFLDADDYIEPSFIDNLILNQMKFNSDFVLCGKKTIDREGHCILERKYDEKFYGKNDFGILLSVGKLIYQKGPWCKLFNASILLKYNIRFVEGAYIGEDEIFLYTYILKCNSASFCSGTGYYYVQTEGSLTTLGTFPYMNELISENAFFKVSDDIFFRYPQYEWIMRRWTFYADRLLNSIYIYPESKKIRLNRVRQIDLKRYVRWKEITSFGEFVLVSLLRLHFFNLYDLCRRLV
ncbi:MAG: glycosyltransferase family 2 protein [Bacteroidales bacterium]|nr:glycosyltransferase family 2 protein [Bacteroidales bacterium]